MATGVKNDQTTGHLVSKNDNNHSVIHKISNSTAIINNDLQEAGNISMDVPSISQNVIISRGRRSHEESTPSVPTFNGMSPPLPIAFRRSFKTSHYLNCIQHDWVQDLNTGVMCYCNIKGMYIKPIYPYQYIT